MQLFDKIQQTLQTIRERTDFEPEYGFIPGTGLNEWTKEIDVVAKFSYSELPHFALSTVQSHKSELVFGKWMGKNIVALAGRFHYYEGYSLELVTYPVRIFKALGVRHLFMTNVSGSVNPDMIPGDIVFIKDHINFQPENPLRGLNDERLGLRFPDMMEVYDKTTITRGLAIAEQNAIRAHQGVYLSLQGPNLETVAEYTMFHRWGADILGMSTVPEAIVAKHSNLKLTVISVVSNLCYPPEAIHETTVEEVIEVARKSAISVQKIIQSLL